MRILVVEDEKRLADALGAGLRAEGFAVDLAHDGLEGLWLAREGGYDAMVLDILLPGMNGFRICSTLRAEGNHVPILMLTAKDGELDQAEALDDGADDYLVKPFSYVVLVARLRALLRRGTAGREPVLRSGDLRLDPASRRCWRGEDEVELTPRELALTEFLLRRKGTVVSKPDILFHVWQNEFDGDPNIVEVYVNRLRRKLDRPYGIETITTVRGEGYRLEDGGHAG